MHRSLAAVALGCAMLASGAAAQPAGGGEDQEIAGQPIDDAEARTLVARAIDRAPQAEAVAFVAANAKATTLDPARTPKAATMSMREIAVAQCGSLQDGYLDAVQRRNPDIAVAPDARPGMAAYTIKWPACLFVAEAAKIPYTIRKGDTLTEIKARATGTEASSRSDLAKFFNGSGVTLAQARTLQEGKVITLSRATAPTVLVSETLDAATFADRITQLTRGAVRADAERAGVIIGPVRFAEPGSIGSTQNTFAPCSRGDGAGYPFDAAAVDAAYKWSRAAISGSVDKVTVVIVDNGFFGAPCGPDGCPQIVDGRVAESPRFPRKLFDTVQFDRRSGFGPTLSGTGINPLNYWNRKGDGSYFGATDVDPVSGHGTHVAGLALGGPTFVPYRSHFDGTAGKFWLTLVIANLGNGSRALLPGTDRDLGDMLRQIDGRKIVNMSVAFNARPGTWVGDNIKAAIEREVMTLFVAAAGNDGGSLESDDRDLYPANLGGAERNVLTVASLDDAGGLATLSQFSNRSEKYVDIAAPGCRIESWLDADGDPQQVSGTSQATPLVTFGAALLSSVWESEPLKIKNRLLYSGDLLEDAADRAAIRSRSALDIPQALTWTVDRVTFGQGDSTRTLLGTAKYLPTLTCANGADVASDNLKAVKRAKDGATWIFGTRASGELRICPAGPIGGSMQFIPLEEVEPQGIRAIPTDPVDIAIADITDLVRAK
tara:strand:- start:3080 stop:5227 length:2148 start_codon:yes stop_codon:yes gene_type:complete